MLKLSKRYSKLYAVNVYKLNHATLVIQHWFMKQSVCKNEGRVELQNYVSQIFNDENFMSPGSEQRVRPI